MNKKKRNKIYRNVISLENPGYRSVHREKQSIVHFPLLYESIVHDIHIFLK